MEGKEIIANISKNAQNGENQEDEDFYFDEKFYENHFKIGRSFAWPDSFKGLIIRHKNLNNLECDAVFRDYNEIYYKNLNKFFILL